jgi:bifunctional non-homologous end joining protein LigD
MQARIDANDTRLLTRKALDWTKRFPTIAAALRGFGVDEVLLDGAIVSADGRGIPHLNDLAERFRGDVPALPVTSIVGS